MSASKAEKLVKKVLGDRKNANKVANLIRMLYATEDETTLRTIVVGLDKFFTKSWSDLATVTMSEELASYDEWLEGQQNDFWDSIIQLFNHDSVDVKENCLLTSLHLMEVEIRYATPHNQYIPENSSRKVLCAIMEQNIGSSTMLDVFDPALKLADLRYFLVKLFPKCLNEALHCGNEKQEVLEKAFTFLKLVSETMPNDFAIGETLTLAQNSLMSVFPNYKLATRDKYFVGRDVKPNLKALDIKEQRRAFGNSWLEFLRHDLDSGLYKSVLMILQQHLIPNFSSPCLLADFLTRSFSQGGGIALLSLHGIFILMTEHNLEYLHFYKHLYSMIHPRIFDAKYQSRFFFLLNVFLSSTHLPAYLVAAFAKKLARLSLVAPAYAQQLLVNFILTLVERHPSIEVLINRKNVKKSRDSTIKSDPYIASEDDPAQCKAVESSLWELNALKNHCLSSVATYVKEIDKGPKHDVMDQLEESYEDAFAASCKKDFSDAPMNYKAPQELFGGFEDSVMDLWLV